MKKLVFLIFLFINSVISTYSQIPNPGFENWTSKGFPSYLDPNGWGTLNGNTNLIGIQTAKQASGSDAYAGSYALKLETFYISFANEIAPGIIATGTFNTTNQTIDGGIPYTQRPSFLQGWYKYYPQSGDNCDIDVTLYKWNSTTGTRDKIGEGSFTTTNTVSSYTQFQANITYFLPDNPDTAVIILSSSNTSTPKQNSVLFVDELSFVMTAPLTASVSTTGATCAGVCNGTATASVSGGTAPISYLWSNGSTGSSLTGLCSGTYNVIVSDPTGATVSASAIVNNQLTLNPPILTSTPENCGAADGTAIVVFADGLAPHSYVWSDAGAQTNDTAIGLSAGAYSVTITDNNGCTISETVTIANTGGLTVSINKQDVSCYGGNDGSATAVASGGTPPYSYNWSIPWPPPGGLQVGTYTVTVTDSSGCIATASTTINQPDSIVVTISSNGNSATAIATGGVGSYSYIWSNGQTLATATGLPAGNASVTVTDGNGCSSSASTTIVQSTYDRVYSIFQNSCATACHNSSSPDGNLNLALSKEDVYAALVNVNATNPHAGAKGYKRVKPGYPRMSFLFRKVNAGLDPGITLDVAEGAVMPYNQPAISEVERELIRQWILFGAPDTGSVVNEQVPTDYYVNSMGLPMINMPPVPDPANGVQIEFGPYFLVPKEEVEFSLKRQLGFLLDYDVTRVDAHMNNESHHLALYKFYPGKDTIFKDGMRPIKGINDAAGIFFNADVVSQWANSYDLELPANTAFRWQANTVLDMSYHIYNFHSTMIMPAMVYVNIYFEPDNSRQYEMFSEPIYYGGQDNIGDLIIPNNNLDTTFTWHHFHPDSAFYWNIWSMMGHTHQIGVGYNVYTRNLDGTKGDHIYIGTYNQDHSFDMGFYDWSHPPIREFDPLYPVDMTKGLIHEATFRNNGQDTVGFGLTTEDEMFVTYMHYVKSQFPLGVSEQTGKGNLEVQVYPNPFSLFTSFKIDAAEGEEKTFRLFNIYGKEVVRLEHLESNVLHLKRNHLTAGTYFYRIETSGGASSTGKLIIAGE